MNGRKKTNQSESQCPFIKYTSSQKMVQNIPNRIPPGSWSNNHLYTKLGYRWKITCNKYRHREQVIPVGKCGRFRGRKSLLFLLYIFIFFYIFENWLNCREGGSRFKSIPANWKFQFHFIRTWVDVAYDVLINFASLKVFTYAHIYDEVNLRNVNLRRMQTLN